MIAEKDIDSVFGAEAIAELAKPLKLSAQADFTRFSENNREAARAYFAELNRTDWDNIRDKIRELYRLTKKADRGDSRVATRKSREAIRGAEKAAALLADRIHSLDQGTRD